MANTHVVVVIDRSGSMGAIRDDAQGAINQFLADQGSIVDESTISLWDFDTIIEKKMDARRIEKGLTYTLEPRGGTALYDALGKAITGADEFLKSKDGAADQPKNILLAVLTDGQENSSREFSKTKITEMIKDRQERYGWQIMYLSSDANAWADAKAIGIYSQNFTAYQSTADGYRAASASISASTTASRTA